jgi:hypothetical protein
MIVLGLGALDQSIVATALPRIVGELGGITRGRIRLFTRDDRR